MLGEEEAGSRNYATSPRTMLVGTYHSQQPLTKCATSANLYRHPSSPETPVEPVYRVPRYFENTASES
eukprot:2100266-Rhodomonas_salina.2